MAKKLEEIVERVYPNEACGFLMGEDLDGERRINTLWEVENVSRDDRKRRFAINPKDYLEAEKRAISENLILQGIFHSHPDHPAIPSEHDLKAAVPFFSYIIVSVKEGSTEHARSWKLSEESEFIEEILTIE